MIHDNTTNSLCVVLAEHGFQVENVERVWFDCGARAHNADEPARARRESERLQALTQDAGPVRNPLPVLTVHRNLNSFVICWNWKL